MMMMVLICKGPDNILGFDSHLSLNFASVLDNMQMNGCSYIPGKLDHHTEI